MKSTAAIFAAVLLSVSVLTACSTNSGTNIISSGDSTETKKEKYHYTLCTGNFGPWDENPKMVKYWEDYFGDVTFELVYVESNQRADKINLLIASGQTPDVMHGVDGRALQEQKVIGGWEESFFRTNAPDLAARMDEQDKSSWALSKYDGKLMYSIPNFRANNLYANVIVWRDDWLKKVGIDKIPQDLSDVEAAFYKFAKEDPDQNGKNDTYGLSSTTFDSIYGAFGTMRNMWIKNDDGTLSYGDTLPAAKEAVELLHKWYKDGVIDPEFITGENEGGYWAISDAFNKNKIGCTGTGQWYHWHPDLGELGFNGRCTLEFKKTNPNGSFAIGYPPIGPTGKRGTVKQDMRVFQSHFSAELVADTGRLARLLQIANALDGKDIEMSAAADMGIKGEDWDYSEYKGKKILKCINPELADPAKQNAIGAGMTFMFINETGSLEYQKMRYGAAHVWAEESLADKNYGYINQIPITLPSSSKYKTELDKILSEGFISIITGDKPIDYFDEMVKSWKANGGDILTQEANEWYTVNK